MSRKKLGLLVLAVMVTVALVPALLTPSVAEAVRTDGSWHSWIPNHPKACVLYPFDCFVSVDVFTPVGP